MGTGQDGTGQGDEPLKPWQQDALEALQWDWGGAYLIGFDEKLGWWAARRDRIGDIMTADGPDALRREIAENYALKPVPRGLDPEEATVP